MISLEPTPKVAVASLIELWVTCSYALSLSCLSRHTELGSGVAVVLALSLSLSPMNLSRARARARHSPGSTLAGDYESAPSALP